MKILEWLFYAAVICVVWNILIGVEGVIEMHSDAYFSFHKVLSFIGSPILATILYYERHQTR